MDFSLKGEDSVVELEITERQQPQSSRIRDFYKENEKEKSQKLEEELPKHSTSNFLVNPNTQNSKSQFPEYKDNTKKSLITARTIIKTAAKLFKLTMLLLKTKNKLINISPFRRLNNFKADGQYHFFLDLACDRQSLITSANKKASKAKYNWAKKPSGSKTYLSIRRKIEDTVAAVYFRKAFLKFQKEMITIAKAIPVISPNTYAKSLWDLMIFIMIIYNFFTIPIELSFQIEFYIDVDYLFRYLTLLTNFSFIVDIILKFNTSIYESGNLITSRIDIAKKYINSYELLIDLISVLPKLVIDFIPGTYSLSLLFFIKYYQYKRFLSTLENLLDQNEKFQVLISLFDLLIKVIFFSHSVACSWHAIAYYNDNVSLTWLDYGRLRNAHWLEKYLNGLYWIVACMVTCGYGEKVSPQNNNELISGVIFIMLGSGVLGYTISTIGGAKDLWQKKNKEIKRNLRVISRYMKSNNVDFNLQMKIRNYLEFILQGNNKEEVDNEEALISTLSYDLKEELLKCTNGKFLQKYAIFQNFSQGALDRMLFRMKKECFKPEENITLHSGPQNSGDFRLFMISSGEIELFVSKDGSKRQHFHLKQLKSGDMFGEIPFFLQQISSVRAKSCGFSSAYTITLDDLKDIAKENPYDYESYCQLRDSLVLYKDLSLFKLNCFACGKFDHTLLSCPDIFLKPNKDRILKKYCYNPTNPFRKRKFKRKKTIKTGNCLLNSAKIREGVFLFREDYCESSSDSESDEKKEESQDEELIKEEDETEENKKIKHDNSLENLLKLQNPAKPERLMKLPSTLKFVEKEREEFKAGSVKFLQTKRETEAADLRVNLTKQSTLNQIKNFDKQKSKAEGEKVLITNSAQGDENRKRKTNVIALRFLNMLKTQSNEMENEDSSLFESRILPLYAPDFDSMKSFKKYFTHNNIDKVLLPLNMKVEINSPIRKKTSAKTKGNKRIKLVGKINTLSKLQK